MNNEQNERVCGGKEGEVNIEQCITGYTLVVMYTYVHTYTASYTQTHTHTHTHPQRNK